MITPYPAGGGLGSALWGITQETDLIVYANGFNHRNELHLQRCALGDPKLQKPALLIADAYNAATVVPARTALDARLFEAVFATLRGGGNVLVPVDSGSRILEVCLAFDRHWAQTRGKRGAYNLALFCPLHKSMLGIAQQNMNFMAEDLSNQFAKDRINPFKFRYVHQCSSREELDEIRGPKVVFATTNTLEHGCAHDLFGEWAQDERNLVVLTDRSARGTLACRLAVAARDAVAEGSADGGGANKQKGGGRRKKKRQKIAAPDVLDGGMVRLSLQVPFTKRWKEDLKGPQLDLWMTAMEVRGTQAAQTYRTYCSLVGVPTTNRL